MKMKCAESKLKIALTKRSFNNKTFLFLVLGKWSAEVPQCEEIICPPIEPSNPKLQLLEHNNSFGGRVVFTCMWGNRLSGSQSIKCEGDGVWNDSVPKCIGESNFIL